MYQELKFNRKPLTVKQMFLQKIKLIYKMLTTDRFIFIELEDNLDKTSISVQPIIFNASIKEMGAVAKELHIRTIPVVYKDVSKANQLMKSLNETKLTLCN
jgi:hypothetical protein